MPELYRYRDEDFFCHHTRTDTPEPSVYPMHAHDKCEILYIVSGQGNFTVEGLSYPAAPGDVFITRPAETHKINMKPDIPYERYALHFSSDMIKRLGFGSLLSPFYDRQLGTLNRYTNDSFSSVIYAHCIESACSHGADKQRITAYLLAFLSEISNSFCGTRFEGCKRVQTPETSLVDYVNNHLFEDITLEGLGRQFYMSENSVNRMFRRAAGTTVGEYIRIKRLLSARERIRCGDFAADAAAACGFGDYSAFYRAYKKHFGRSPREDSPE